MYFCNKRKNVNNVIFTRDPPNLNKTKGSLTSQAGKDFDADSETAAHRCRTIMYTGKQAEW